ncbi:MAG: M14 family zinc carboxypeptidase, partial [Pseudomonadota bacterium]
MTQGDSCASPARPGGSAWLGPVLAGAVLAALAAGGLWIAPRADVERGTTAQHAATPVQVLQAPAPPAATTEPAAPVPAAPVAAAAPAAGPGACALFLARLPTVSRAQCEDAQLTPSGALSAHGVPLFWRDVPVPGGRAAADAPLRVLVAGAIHGDELTAAALALRWIALAEQTERPVHWRFIPVLNPDGLLARPATRTNGRGVDLNRNFPTPGWDKDAPLYWDKRTRRDPRRFPGPSALSEPESQFLHAQMAAFRPHLIVSIHAPYGVLDFDGPLSPPERLGRLWLDQVGIFPGSLGNYGGVHRGMP